MSHQSKIFNSVPVDIPNRSAFDMSHENVGTLKVGTLTPVLVEELLPGDSVDLSHVMQVQLPPMATDFYGRVDLRLEAFFVPNRILWGGWQNFITTPLSTPFSASPTTSYKLAVPSCYCSYDNFSSYCGPNSLMDYLGIKSSGTGSLSEDINYYILNILPILAYYKIYDDWYRNSNIQQPLFQPIGGGSSASYLYALPTIAYSDNSGTAVYELGVSTFADGTILGDLKQRNWERDYFTTAHLYPQANSSIASATIIQDTTSLLSISQIRAANVLQRWIERNNLAGTRYVDQIQATFGVRPSDAIQDRPLYLGSSRFGVYNNSVYTQSGNSETSNNPFSGLTASESAACKGFGKDNLINNFRCDEHGYIFVIASLVPHAYYATGSRRYLQRHVSSDFANPLLQGLGEQPIFNWELSDYYFGVAAKYSSLSAIAADYSNVSNIAGTIAGDVTSSGYTSMLQNSTSNVFGYTQQFADYKYHDDEIHGLLRDGQSLSSFVLSRAFSDESLDLSSEFIEIPTTAMDDVTAVTSALSDYGAWYDIAFNFKKISTLSEYVIPTLGDLKNTHIQNIPYNGTML